MPELRYIRAITEALKEEMARDEKVFIAGEDVGRPGGPFSATRGLLEQFGQKRVKDTPISEAAIIGLATGAAITGLRPVVEIMFMDFIGTCWDQIFNQAAKLPFMSGGQIKIPMVIRTTCGAGQNAGPQHSGSYEAWALHTPGLKVVMPSTPFDAKGLLKAAIRDDGPVLFIENKTLYGQKGEVPDQEYLLPLGKAEIKREGQHITLVATSRMVLLALNVAQKMEQEGISLEIIDLRTISPLDKETILASVQKTKRLIVAHEAVKTGGIGAEIVATITEEAFKCLEAPPIRIGAPSIPVPYSPPLEKAYLPNEEDIIRAVREVLEG